MALKTITGTAAGTCLECGFVNSSAEGATTKNCTGCSTRVVLSFVRGEYSDRHPCDPACQYAIGNFCVCACGGENHRAGYIDEHLVPVWVRQRDTERHTARVARAEGKAAAARASAAEGMAALLAEHPGLEGLAHERYNDEYGFAADMRRALENGAMSDRQVTAALAMIERDERRERQQAERDTERAALLAAGVTVPTGRQQITGTIVAVKEQEDRFSYTGGVQYRLIIKAEAGWLVMGTLPGSLEPTDYTGGDSDDVGSWQHWLRHLPGRRVTMTVTLDGPGDDADPLFGFYKRPSRAAYVTG
jgi:hypothetical protein